VREIFKALVAAATRFARSERKASVAPAPAPAGGGFPVAAHEAALDRLVEIAHAATRESAAKALAVIADAQASPPVLTNEPAPEGAVLH
jgi:flagellar biosynthesis/type III secretory pathway ATPase